MKLLFVHLPLLWFGLLAVLAVPPVNAAEKLQFNRDVRPILSDKCFFCHGTDANHRKGNLRLDESASAFKPAESGATAIVPGSPDKSELIARIGLHDSDDEVMPPVKSGKSLNSKEKAILKQWISEGAVYEGHWAFTPVKMNSELVKTPQGEPLTAAKMIDHFISERLAKEGLAMADEASPETLVRRVTLDLTGLPPTPTEVDAFVAAFRQDRSAFEKLVDRLLHSPRYGERMAMQWLDYARYADSHGFQTDSSRFQWPWRDWVIQAFNDNKPFDQFTTEQLAGDLLPNASRDQIVATGFNRNHRLNGEGGIIAEEWRIENVIDRTETMGLTWLALTLNCCRCHDHKYDPITQKDFYSFFAFFNNVPESGTIQGASNRSGGNSPPVITVPNAEQEKKLAALQLRVTTATQKVAELQPKLHQWVAEWEPKAAADLAKMQSSWTMLVPKKVESKHGATLVRQSDGSYLATGANPAKDVYLFDAPLPAEGATGFLLECLTDPSLPGGGPGRNSNSNFALSQFEVYRQRPGGKPERLNLAKAEADYSQKGYDIQNTIAEDKGRRGSWAVDGPTKKEPRRAMFVMEQPIKPDAGVMLLLRLRHEAIGNHNIGRFRISASSQPAPLLKLTGDGISPTLRPALATAPNQRSAQQQQEIRDFFRNVIPNPLKAAEDELAAATSTRDAFENTLPSVMVMKEEPKPRDTFVLGRGEYDKPTEKVTAALPRALAPAQKSGMNRLDLARWITSPDNPLTARVWVNRQWEKLFGTGLVKTVENFGMQAEYPSHPELLDWLAAEFIRLGWDMKGLQKQIIMSAAYRQSGHIKAGHPGSRLDPENRLLWRGPRIRLSGEIVRDQALALSGLLVGKIGGPSVRPYMPEGVWDETSKYGDLRGYKPDTGEGLYRRTMYTIWKRTAAPPTMLLFDSPTREICTVKRSRTNTPLQALALLNEVTFVEAARALAEQMLNDTQASHEKRLSNAFKQVTSRSPTQDELAVLMRGLQGRLTHYQAYPDEAKQLLNFGSHVSDAKANATELAAYTLTANVLLNLDEVVTRP